VRSRKEGEGKEQRLHCRCYAPRSATRGKDVQGCAWLFPGLLDQGNTRKKKRRGKGGRKEFAPRVLDHSARSMLTDFLGPKVASHQFVAVAFSRGGGGGRGEKEGGTYELRI